MYLDNVISILGDLSNKNYQIRIWLNTDNPNNVVDSFVEAANGLFDDCIIGDLLEDSEIIISKEVTKVLQELLMNIVQRKRLSMTL